MDTDVVTRNVIMLLLVLTISDEQEAAETVIHVWYSALIRHADMKHVEVLRPLIQNVCDKIADRKSRSLQAKTFSFASCSVRVTLTKETWTILLASLYVPPDLSMKLADNIRLKITNPPQRKDYHHREYIFQPPEHRICKERFHEDGILVPFGFSRAEFTIPNPYVT